MNLLSLAFFNVGGSELLVIMAIVLILFGGDKLPEFAKGFGKAMREFKKATNGVEEEIRRAMEEEPAPPPANPHQPVAAPHLAESTVKVTTTTALPATPPATHNPVPPGPETEPKHS